MNILTINASLSGIKYKLFRLHTKNKVTLLHSGQVASLEKFHENSSLPQINCIINRIPYACAEYREIVLLHAKTLEVLGKYNGLLVEEQTYNLRVAQHFLNIYPKIKNYATFDTEFHATVPKINYDYTSGFEKFCGYHGLSYSYIAGRLDSLVDSKIAKGRWIIAHLGRNSSVCGIKNGKSNVCLWQDTTALLKLSDGISNDIEVLLTSKEEAAKFAVEYFANMLAALITRVATPLGGIDGIVFTGSLGENNSFIRAMVVDKLKWVGISLNKKANNNHKLKIAKKDCSIKVLLVPNNEEMAMVDRLVECKL